jgi:hypothetical protein
MPSFLSRARRVPPRVIVSVLLAWLAVIGCAHKIGDSCSMNIECSPTGDRVCDQSQPGGYCTQEGCLAGSCPVDEGVCVRYLDLSSTPCYDQAGNFRCDRGDICVEGFCAPLRSERRACLLICQDQGGCRTGYQCIGGGVGGAEIVDTDQLTAKFCAPLNTAVPEL